MNDSNNAQNSRSKASPTAYILDKALNNAIKYDLDAQAKLKPHIGKTVHLEIKPIALHLWLTIAEDHITVKSSSDTAADTTISGKPSSLFAMASNQHISGLDSVVINGDATLGQFIADFLKNLNPDTEEALCATFGEMPGYHLANALKGLRSQAERLGSSFVENMKDFLVHEDRSLIAPAEMEQFLDGVDDLQADLVRVERKIKQLKDNKSAWDCCDSLKSATP